MKISALVLTHNEEEMIAGCLEQLKFADEIIVLDQNSKDKTRDIAAKYTKEIFTTEVRDFDKNRILLATKAKNPWLLYIDADERFSRKLIEEIEPRINDNYSIYYFPRKNIILGKWLKHGGWWPDYVPKLFKKSSLKSWRGRVHETPVVDGEAHYLKNPIEHLTARSMEKMLKKTKEWAKVEAELIYAAHNPKVTILKVIKAMSLELLNRYFLKLGLLDGVVGLVEAIFQSLHKAAILTYLWELQNNSEEKFKNINVR